MVRPECCYAVSKLSTFLANPTEQHMEAIMQVIQYLVGIANHGLLLRSDGQGHNLRLRIYTDAAYQDDLDNRRSIGGFVAMLLTMPVAWKSGRQPIVTLSSTEAEYVALTHASKEAIVIGRLLEELRYKGPIFPVTIYEDNMPAINITQRHSSAAGRTRHIDTRYHYIREAIQAKKVAVKWIATAEQVADGLTKPLDRLKFEAFTHQLGITDCKAAIAKQTVKASEY
jgi:hypothetical protein